MTAKIRIATRGSKLALWQANYVASLLHKLGAATELNVIKTAGDRIQDRFLHEFGGKGLFIKELEKALVDKDADIAVHSLKDLPAKVPLPFTLGAVLKRHAAGDVLIFQGDKQRPALFGKKDLSALGAFRIGTASLRRQSFLKQASKTLLLQAVRGNVDTRINKLQDGSWDAIILAHAAIERLGYKDLSLAVLDPRWFVPAPAQGALAIETLEGHPVLQLLRQLDHAPSHKAVAAERKVLEELGGDCSMPIGCHIVFDGDQAIVDAAVLDYEGEAATCHLQEKAAEPQAKLVAKILGALDKNGLPRILDRLAAAKPDLGAVTSSNP